VANFDVSYIYRVVNKYSQPVRQMVVSTEAFRKKISQSQASLKKMSIELNRTSRRMANFRTAVGTIGAVGAVKSLISTTASLDDAMNKTQATVFGTTKLNDKQKESLNRLRTEAMKWGAETQFSAVQVGEAMAELGMKGQKTTGILGLMPGVMNLAAAGQLTLADAAMISQDILGQFGEPVQKSKYVVNLLAKAAANSSQSVTEIAAAMRNTGVQAKLSGQDVKQTTVLLMALAQKGERGSRAGTILMNMFKDLSKAPKKVMVGFKKLGINIDQFRNKSTGQITDFIGLLDIMRKRGAAGKVVSEMFNVRSAKALNLLLGTTNKQLAEFAATQNDATGAGAEMAKVLMQGLPGQIKLAESAFEGLKIAMLKEVLPAVISVMKWMTNFISNLQKNNPTLLKWATISIMVAAAIGAIIVPLGIVVAAVSAAMPVLGGLLFLFKAIALATPFGLIATAVGAVIFGIIRLVKVWDKLVAAWKDKGPLAAIKVLFGGLWKYIEKIGSFLSKFNIGGLTAFTTKTETTSKQVAVAAKGSPTNNLNVSGNIGVQAEKGTKVTAANINLNTGGQDFAMVGA
jgi:TP901 family phage tail tape measure protein